MERRATSGETIKARDRMVIYNAARAYGRPKSLLQLESGPRDA
jgi:hypothetical protein